MIPLSQYTADAFSLSGKREMKEREAYPSQKAAC
jgi:hypothetical protein